MRGLQEEGPLPWAYWEGQSMPTTKQSCSGLRDRLCSTGWALAAAGYQADTEENRRNRADYLLLFT